jgi:O-antigen ligase
MVSRIAKAFQDYTVNVIIQKFGAALFTDGLKHSMQLPFQAFEDQRSGETLSILTKARADCEKFISYVVNVLFGIIVSFTRATWLSLIVSGGLWVLLRMKIRFVWILIVLFTVSTIAVVKQDDILYSLESNKQGSSDELEGHVKSVSNITTDPSNLERINRWNCAGRMVSERPVFGFGPGTYVFKYGPFQKSSELTLISTNSGDLGDAHSEFLSAMSEMGYTGLAILVTLVLTTISYGFKIIYNTTELKVKLTAYMALLSLMTYYTHAVLNNYSQYDKLAVPLWAFTAIIAALDLYHKNGINHVKKTV